jgi:hypothetical protein
LVRSRSENLENPENSENPENPENPENLENLENPENLSTRRMLTAASQLGLVAGVLTVFAAVLAERSALGHHAVAGRVRAFRGICHTRPPRLCSGLYASAPHAGKLKHGVAAFGVHSALTPPSRPSP